MAAQYTTQNQPDSAAIIVGLLGEADKSEAAKALFQESASLERANELLSLASAHGVNLLVHRVLQRVFSISLQDVVLTRLKLDQTAAALRNLRLAGELVQLSTLFSDNGILAVPIKGPALALTAFGDVALRSFQDLDFVVRPPGLLRARDLLASVGFRMQSSVHWKSDSAYSRSINSEFTMSRQQTFVDLHWRLLPEYFPFRLDSERLWDDVSTITVAGREVPAFSAEHQLLYLAAHGAKHDWAKLKWACDFAKYVQVVPLDWNRAIDLCRSAGSLRVLTHALLLVEALFDVRLPEIVRPHIDRTAERIAHQACARYLHSEGERASVIAGALFLNSFSTGAMDTIRLLHGLTIAPTEAEWQLLRLPPLLYPLYYPFRLFRLAAKHTIGRLLA